jgi:hypothetical protein
MGQLCNGFYTEDGEGWLETGGSLPCKRGAVRLGHSTRDFEVEFCCPKPLADLAGSADGGHSWVLASALKPP